ncbi:hypothetical protein DBV15_08170 [Temnothorax longispinosus]|uniref:Uncharacterized protein n=1 Tax=Temnothorax longispinosus TaxID=300112 RepID=A0A4S2KEA8_9HYME|nr:hypothetical protein DBV15_08170 [Temnothorax longispinosus]
MNKNGGEAGAGKFVRREGGYQRGRRGISIPGEATDSASANCIADASAVLNREILRSNLSPS